MVKKFFAGVLLSFGFVCLLAAVAGVVSKDVEDRGAAVVVSLMLGVPPTALALWLIHDTNQQAKQTQQQRLQSAFFRLLTAGDGKITPLQFSMETGLPGDAAKQYLDARAREFNATFDVDEQGGIFYCFHLGEPERTRLPGGESIFPSAITAGSVAGSARFDVILHAVPDPRKIEAIKRVRAVTGLGLKEAKDLVEATPVPICRGVSRIVAEDCKRALESIGATVSLMEN